jgi:hypothetical protein
LALSQNYEKWLLVPPFLPARLFARYLPALNESHTAGRIFMKFHFGNFCKDPSRKLNFVHKFTK